MSTSELDDDLGRLLRAANPVPVDPDERPSLRALGIRDRIVAAGPVHAAVPVGNSRRLRRRWAAVVVPMFAVAAAIVAVVLAIVPVPQAAVAVTPRPLEFTPIGQPIGAIVTDAQSTLGAGGGPAEPVREVVTVGWYYQVDDLDTDAPSQVISPQVTTLTWAEDLSGSTRTVAGTPYWADGATDPVPQAVAPPGTLIWEMTFAAGEFQVWTVDPPGDTVEAMRATLAENGLAEPASAFDVLDSIETLMQTWTLTNAQHAALLQIVADTPGIDVLGATTDRAGRPVIGISATNPRGPSELHLFISRDTGRIVGSETYTTAADGPFPADAIISYSMRDPGSR